MTDRDPRRYHGHAIERSDGGMYPSLQEAARCLRRERQYPERPPWSDNGVGNIAFRIAKACKTGRTIYGYQWKRRVDLEVQTP